MNKPAVFKDYGQESFTLSEIKAFRNQDEKKRKQKQKKTANRIRTK